MALRGSMGYFERGHVWEAAKSKCVIVITVVTRAIVDRLQKALPGQGTHIVIVIAIAIAARLQKRRCLNKAPALPLLLA